MAQAQPLSEEMVARIYGPFWSAKAALAEGDQNLAARYSYEAWSLVPEPKFGWDRSYMFLLMLIKFARPAGRHDELIAIVDAYIASEFYLEHEDGPHFWLGTLYFEKGDLLRAFECLDRAQKMSGGRCFLDEDPKYRRFYKTNNPPLGAKPSSKSH